MSAALNIELPLEKRQFEFHWDEPLEFEELVPNSVTVEKEIHHTEGPFS